MLLKLTGNSFLLDLKKMYFTILEKSIFSSPIPYVHIIHAYFCIPHPLSDSKTPFSSTIFLVRFH